MQTQDVIEKFKTTGALLEGHFILSSGLHSQSYLQCALVLQYPSEAESFARAIAAEFKDKEIQLIGSPAIGGIVIGYEVARQLGARFVWTEREEGKMTLRRGFNVRNGERTLVVEDVITTGGSTRETVQTLEATGAKVIAAASIIDRSSGNADVGVPLFSLASLQIPSVAASDCEQCKLGLPATKPGSRKSKSS